MADRALVESLMNAFPEGDERRALVKAFEEVLTFMRLGDANEARSVNFGGTFLTATLSTTANAETAIAHGLGQTPYMVFPVMPLDSTLARIVSLQVAREADNQFVYLRSTTAGARVTLYLEG